MQIRHQICTFFTYALLNDFDLIFKQVFPTNFHLNKNRRKENERKMKREIEESENMERGKIEKEIEQEKSVSILSVNRMLSILMILSSSHNKATSALEKTLIYTYCVLIHSSAKFSPKTRLFVCFFFYLFYFLFCFSFWCVIIVVPFHLLAPLVYFVNQLI